MKFKKLGAAISVVIAAIMAISGCGGEVHKVKEVSAELKGTVLDNFGYGLALYDDTTQSAVVDKYSDIFPGSASFSGSIYEMGNLRRHVSTDIYKTFDEADEYGSIQTELLSYYFDTVGAWANESTKMLTNDTLSWCAVISDLTAEPVLAVLTDDYFITGELATVVLIMHISDGSALDMTSYLEYYNTRLEEKGYSRISWIEPVSE